MMGLLGLIFVGGGIALVMWVNRRAFYRRNQAGVEVHRDFSSLVGSRLVEMGAGFAAFVLIVLGAGMALFGCVRGI